MALAGVVWFVQRNNPGFLLTSFCDTFLTLMMFFTIENPDVKLLSEETVVDDDNLVSIQVSVSNHKDSSPIREVSVVIQDMPGISFIVDNNVSYNAIDGGELSIFKLKLRISDEIRRLKATPLKATCKYRSGSSMIEKSYDLSLKLYSPSERDCFSRPS